MKVGDKVEVTYSDGIKIGEIKKETSKQFHILFEDGEFRRVSKTKLIKKIASEKLSFWQKIKNYSLFKK